MSAKKILTLGKSLKENIDDAYEKFITGGGSKGKKITIQKKDIDKKITKQEQVSKKAENLSNKQKKTKKVKKENVLSKDKQVNKAKQNRKIKQQKSKKQSTDLVPTGQSKTIKETVNPKKIKQNFKTVGSPVDKTPKVKKPKKKSTALVTVPSATAKNIFNKQKQSFIKRNKGPIAGTALLAATSPFLMDKGNVGEGSVIGGSNKDKKSLKKLKNIKVKTIKTKPLQQKKKDMPKVSTQKKSRSNIKGSSSYDAQFTYDNLKKRGLNPKGRMSPENYAKVKKLSAGKTVGLKPLPPKSESPGIHKLPAKAKMNMGFKPMFGGGLIAGLYDKPEKTEKHKGNSTSARQIKGYGKARRKA